MPSGKPYSPSTPPNLRNPAGGGGDPFRRQPGARGAAELIRGGARGQEKAAALLPEGAPIPAAPWGPEAMDAYEKGVLDWLRGEIPKSQVPPPPPRKPPGKKAPSGREREMASDLGQRREDIARMLENMPGITGPDRFIRTTVPEPWKRKKIYQKKYPGADVEWADELGEFIITIKDDKGNVVKRMREDEQGLTWGDLADTVAYIPEMGFATAAWAKAASAWAPAPQARLATFGLAALATGVGKGVRFGQDWLAHKWHIPEEEFKAGDVAKRLGTEAIPEILLGGVAARLLGGAGKAAQKPGGSAVYDEGADIVIAREAAEAAERQGIPLSAAMRHLQAPAVKAEAHAKRMAQRSGLIDPRRTQALLRQFDAPLEAKQSGIFDQFSLAADPKATSAGVSGAMGRQVQRAKDVMTARRSKLGSEAAGEQQAALTRATGAKGGVAPSDVGTAVRADVNAKLESFREASRKMYSDTNDALNLATGGKPFIKLNKLEAEIKSYIDSLPKETKKSVVETGVLDAAGEMGTRIVRKEIPAGGTGAGKLKQARDLLRITDTPQGLLQAQMIASDLKEGLRQAAKSGDTGVVGFDRAAVRRFTQALDDDIEASMVALKEQKGMTDDVFGMYRDAQKHYRDNVVSFNKSDLIGKIEDRIWSGQTLDPAEIVDGLVTAKGLRGDDLLLIKKLIPTDTYNKLRRSIADRLTGGHTLELPSGHEVVDLAGLRRHLKGMDKNYANELLGGAENVKALDDAIKSFEVIYSLQKNLGKPLADINTLKGLIDEATRGVKAGPARNRIVEAIKTEAKLRKRYANELYKDFHKNEFGLVNALVDDAPELFVDTMIMGNKDKLQLGYKVFKQLPKDVQLNVSREATRRILVNSMDSAKLPLGWEKGGKGAILDHKKLKERLYGEAGDGVAREKIIREIIGKDTADTLTDVAKILHAKSRYDEIAGAAGAFAVETSMGSGSWHRLVNQIALARLVMSPAGQAFLSRGVHNPKGMAKLFGWAGRAKDVVLPPVYKPTRTAYLVGAASGAKPLSDKFKELDEEEQKALGGLFGAPEVFTDESALEFLRRK